MKKNKKILVIDDDISTLEIILMVLGNAGFIVEVENNCELNFLKRNKIPDIILMDNNLGERTGSELCKQLKQDERMKHIPVILISAMEDVSAMAIDACADDFLMKPFGIAPLMEKINFLLGKSMSH